MALIKRTNSFFPSVPSLFDDFFTRDMFDWSLNNFADSGSSLPAVNIKEDEKEYSVEVAAPGLKKEDFKIELDHNVLTISSEKEYNDEQKDNEGNYTRREFSYTAFKRSFNLPENQVNADKISANYSDGVLHIHLPKMTESKAKPVKTIKIG